MLRLRRRALHPLLATFAVLSANCSGDISGSLRGGADPEGIDAGPIPRVVIDAGSRAPRPDASPTVMAAPDASETPPPPPAWTRIEIRPPSATISTDYQRSERASFAAFAIDAAGREEEVTTRAVWRSLDDRIGSIDPSTGRYTALGARPGVDRVRAGFLGLQATAEVRVHVSAEQTEDGAGDAEAMFDGANTSGASLRPSVVYPESRTVIPKNLVPMLIQWDAPDAIDRFRVRFEGPLFRATIYTAARRAKLNKPEWVQLLESTAPGVVRVEIAGLATSNPSEVHTSEALEIKIADGLMRGTVYYWALSSGRILRIRPGAEAYEDFFLPPAKPDTTNNCVGCHALSHDGTKMAFEYWGGSETSGVVDVVAPDPPLVGPAAFAANFMAFDPTGDKILGVLDGALSIHDARSGARIEDVLPRGSATMPVWSPDGDTIAYASAVPDRLFTDIDFFESDLSIIRGFTGGNRTPAVLVPAGGMANTYPSFSPDSRFVAYSRGPYSRAHRQFDSSDRVGVSPGDLYLVPLDGSRAPVRLDQASRGGQAFFPAFSPFEGGGYLWLAFFSRRDYGHVTAGTTRRQVWVTAVDPSAAPGTDPSAPAFWLPAQEPATENMSAYWAPDPCHPEGDTCDLDDDCCNKNSPSATDQLLCRPDPRGAQRCIARANACRVEGEACVSTSECCSSARLTCEQTANGSVCMRPEL